MKINWFVLNECHLFSPVAQIFANNLNVHYFYFNKNDLEFYSMTFIYFMNISALLHINNINGHERFSILPLYIWQRENWILYKLFKEFEKISKIHHIVTLNSTAIYAALMAYNAQTTRIRYQILKFWDEQIFPLEFLKYSSILEKNGVKCKFRDIFFNTFSSLITNS